MKSRFPSLDVVLSDPARVNVLYSSFRSRSLNPDHYDQKMRFWNQVIDEYSSSDKRICLTVTEMENVFKTEQNQRPACLQEVLTNLIRSGQAVRKDIFLSSLPASATTPENSTWFSWSLNQFQKVGRKIWSYNPVSMFGNSSIDKDTPVVYIPQLKSQESLVQNIPNMQNKVMSLEKWKSEVANHSGPVEDLDLLIEYMKASGILLTDLVGSTQIVKSVVSPAQSKKTTSITSAEKGEFDIRQTVAILEKDLEQLYEKQQSAEKQARVALREGKRNTAKSHLRTRKLTEQRVNKLMSVLDNLTMIAAQIEDAVSDVRILAAYESGKEILDKVLTENGMTTDRITEAMLNVQEVLDVHEEISASLAQPLVDEDVAELEQALEELMKEDKNVDKKNQVAAAGEEVSGTENLADSTGFDKDTLEKINQLTVEDTEPASAKIQKEDKDHTRDSKVTAQQGMAI